MDRFHRTVSHAPVSPPPLPAELEGWVFVAASSALSTDTWNRLAARFGYRRFGDYIVIDYRIEGPSVEVWDLEEEEPSIAWSVFVTPFEARRVPVRQPDAEAILRSRLQGIN